MFLILNVKHTQILLKNKQKTHCSLIFMYILKKIVMFDYETNHETRIRTCRGRCMLKT